MRRPFDDVVTLGFGTAVAMWMVAYVLRMPPVVAQSWVLGVALLLTLLGGGLVAGAFGAGGWQRGAASGLLTSVLNLLILGSLLGGAGEREIVPSALWWLPGSLVLGAVLGGVGAAIGARWLRDDAPAGERADWLAAFAGLAVAAVLMQLLVGGLVTSQGAGLAVVDWPNSFGYNMFLYPLGRMTGGIFFEHAHRLFGTLVGLTTIALALLTQAIDERRWLRRLAWVAVGLVLVQGLLGGLRVTGRLTLSTSRADVAPSIALAIVHGVLAQLFFALLVAIATFASRVWRSTEATRVERGVSGARPVLAVWLVAALIVQVVLGALQRHLAYGLWIHVLFACVVVTLAIIVGVRAAGRAAADPVVTTFGRWLNGVAIAQLTLGVLALAAVLARGATGELSSWDVTVRTAHQAGGGVLLGCAVVVLMWSWRARPAGAERDTRGA